MLIVIRDTYESCRQRDKSRDRGRWQRLPFYISRTQLFLQNQRSNYYSAQSPRQNDDCPLSVSDWVRYENACWEHNSSLRIFAFLFLKNWKPSWRNACFALCRSRRFTSWKVKYLALELKLFSIQWYSINAITLKEWSCLVKEIIKEIPFLRIKASHSSREAARMLPNFFFFLCNFC